MFHRLLTIVLLLSSISFVHTAEEPKKANWLPTIASVAGITAAHLVCRRVPIFTKQIVTTVAQSVKFSGAMHGIHVAILLAHEVGGHSLGEKLAFPQCGFRPVHVGEMSDEQAPLFRLGLLQVNSLGGFGGGATESISSSFDHFEGGNNSGIFKTLFGKDEKEFIKKRVAILVAGPLMGITAGCLMLKIPYIAARTSLKLFVGYQVLDNVLNVIPYDFLSPLFPEEDQNEIKAYWETLDGSRAFKLYKRLRKLEEKEQKNKNVK